MLNLMAAMIPALPAIAALWVAAGFVLGNNRGESGEAQTRRVVLSAATLSFILLLCIDLLSLFHGKLPGELQLFPWLNSGDYQVNISFLLDGLGLIMAHLVSLLLLITLHFSVNYLHREAGYQRFFIIMSLFTSAMLLIVMAGNTVLTFVGWELAGVCSYLLIAYSHEKTTTTINATRAFVTNKVGDAGFLLSIILSFFWISSTEWNDIFTKAGELDGLQAGLIATGLLIAAMAKSAQIPFTPWIARALEGPTPSSAIFYGALMVHAGVYLVIRMEPLLSHTPELLWMIALAGAATAIYGFIGGLVQSDIKSALMFSTTGQVGLMFFACGLGWFEFATWHLIAHAIWRAYHFLSSPALMHLLPDHSRFIPAWLQKRRRTYTAALQRFWLEHITDWLLVKPILALSKDAQTFDQQVVNRLFGLPGSIGAVSSLAQWEEQKHAHSTQLDGDSGDIGRGRGLIGKLMEWIASLLHWFEEHLVLKGGDDGILQAVVRVGEALTKVDEMLSRPRYLLLMLLLTFVVIL
ncbi:MAG: proton-conducting transporter membrane subunit [Gammaproteobacteria bacterium]